MNPNSGEYFRQLLNLLEYRVNDVTYDESDPDKIIAYLKSRSSEQYTKLAQKFQRVADLKIEIAELEADIKKGVKEDIIDLFDAGDAVKTRVVDTISFVLKLTKDPKPTESPRYKEILTELTKHLTPELIAIMEQLKKQLVTVTQKSPALSIHKKVSEGFIRNTANAFRTFVFSWAKHYDRELNKLKELAA